MVIHKKATKESTNEDESKFIKIWNFYIFIKMMSKKMMTNYWNWLKPAKFKVHFQLDLFLNGDKKVKMNWLQWEIDICAYKLMK